MPLILNLESSTTVCSVALSKDGQLLDLMELNEGYSHAENLSWFAEQILKKNNIDPHQLDAVAISKGPGSYTGLRIGTSVAKGICYAVNKPLIAVETLKHLTTKVQSSMFKVQSGQKQLETSNLEPRTYFCPMLDARRMEVYCALYDDQLNVIESTKAKIIDENSLSEYLAANKIIFFGNGAEKCKSIIKHDNAIFIDTIHPSAADMIPFSEEAFTKKQFEDLAYFEPYYLKEFVSGDGRK